MEIPSSGGSSNMRMYTTSSRWWQVFRYRHRQICNIKNNKCLQASKDEEGAKCGAYSRNNNRNQRWNVVYVDKMGKEASKGWNHKYGFKRNAWFYVKSALPMGRVMQ